MGLPKPLRNGVVFCVLGGFDFQLVGYLVGKSISKILFPKKPNYFSAAQFCWATMGCAVACVVVEAQVVCRKYAEHLIDRNYHNQQFALVINNTSSIISTFTIENGVCAQTPVRHHIRQTKIDANENINFSSAN